jgi:hypothetical protein
VSVRATVQFGRVLPAAALVVGLVGLLRLARQFPAAADSPGLLIPFLMPVLALGLEAGALVALSAAALWLAQRVSVTSLKARSQAFLPLVGLLLATLAAAELVPRGTERPGALANELVDRARAGCADGIALVPVPLLGLNVRCSKPPRVEGPMPGAASIQLGMQELRFSDDLRSVHIKDLQLSAKRSLSLELRVGEARIVGLSPWTRSPRLSPLARLLVLGAVGLVLLIATVGLWRPLAAPEAPAWPRWRRLLTLLLLGCPGAAAAALVITLDQQQASPASYSWSALAGVGTLLGLRLLTRRVPQLLGSRPS